ncbi:hypothetical protein [Sphingomonas sp. CFBP 8760]|uniref:hypothetical protein n=1 Tax=Sphingomonas sp. CFBP 8760 TaxID=2775282 RepID=UPI00178581E0|nr:hypothetical protein [Sphingomonas sp. CFBP 8760]MBD8548277.1 hypothetical protein [Sphingomonas sp. CFBP 8760]
MLSSEKDVMDAANDNAIVSVLPAEVREMLDRCDEAGLGMDFVIDVLRARLVGERLPRGVDPEVILASVRTVFERNR